MNHFLTKTDAGIRARDMNWPSHKPAGKTCLLKDHKGLIGGVFWVYFCVVLNVAPRPYLCVLGKHSTTVLYPQPRKLLSSFKLIIEFLGYKLTSFSHANQPKKPMSTTSQGSQLGKRAFAGQELQVVSASLKNSKPSVARVTLGKKLSPVCPSRVMLVFSLALTSKASPKAHFLALTTGVW